MRRRSDTSSLPVGMLTLAKLKQVVAAEKRKQSSSFVIPFIYQDRDKLEQELSEIYSQCEAVHFPTPYLRFKQLFGGWFSIRKLSVLKSPSRGQLDGSCRI